MKNIAKILIATAALMSLMGIISRLTIIPLAGIEPRAMLAFAGLLLLFAIALEGLK